jgi:RNA polymerase sigma-70 factor, ECF subfamily
MEGAIDRARSGDHEAFAELVGFVGGPLVGFLAARGADDPEGLANEVLVRVFGSIDSFDGGEAQFKAWVFAVARNAAIDEHRRRSRRVELAFVEPDRLPDTGVDAGFGRVDETGRVDALLGLLTDDQREVIVLRVIAGLSVQETAEVLGRGAGAVRALQHRALGRLRKEFSVRA